MIYNKHNKILYYAIFYLLSLLISFQQKTFVFHTHNSFYLFFLLILNRGSTLKFTDIEC